MTTYSTSLKLSLIADGDQAGTWGQTTNTNLGTLLEQAITGVVSITMLDANYTLTNLNGVSDEARNAVIVAGGTNAAVRDIIAPAVEKLYVIKNATVGGYSIRIKTAGGTAVTIPNGLTTLVYCDGTDFYEQLTGAAGNFNIGGNSLITGTLGVTGALSGTTGSFSGDVTFPTQVAGNNSTKAATTAFVGTAITNLNLGTISTQNANNVSITGGSISGITDLAVADGGTGVSTIAANAVVLGNGASPIQTVAPGTNGNVLTSNGTTWTSAAPATPFSWNVTNVGTGIGSGSSYSLPANAILVLGTAYFPMSANQGGRMSVQIKNSGGGVISDFILCGGNENNGTDGGSGMSSRSAWSVAIPAAAAGGSLYFYNSAGGNGFSGTINQVVRSA